MKSWKVGAITSGVLLIAIGILWLLESVIDLPLVDILLNAWPLVCIFLGAEILFLHFRNREEKLRVHWLAIVLVIFIGIASIGFSLGKTIMDDVQFSFRTNTIEINETISASNTETISIDIPEMKTTIIGSDSTDVSLTGKLSAHYKTDKILQDKFNDALSMKQIGNKLVVEINTTDNDFEGMADWDGHIYISVPKSSKLIVNSQNGNMDLSNLSGQVKVTSNWGNISVSNLNGALDATCGGTIDITDSLLTANSVIIADESINWKTLEGQSGTIEAKSKYGDIQGNIGWVESKQEKVNNENNEYTPKKATVTLLAGATPTILLSTADESIQVTK